MSRLRLLLQKKTGPKTLPKGRMSTGGEGGRNWREFYAVYGSDDWRTVFLLLLPLLVLAPTSISVLLRFNPVVNLLHALIPSVSSSTLRLAVAFTGSSAGLSSLCLLCAAASVLYSSLHLLPRISARMVAVVPDWSSVRNVLDVGCGRGILLNAVAVQLKKSGSAGHVVGLDRRWNTAQHDLRRATADGVQAYVTCREGDARHLPFGDASFDVVVSALHFGGRRVARTADEMWRGVVEMVRVLRPGGGAVVWDRFRVPEVVERLTEMGMEEISVSERITAYMASSHIVAFRKPVVPPVTEPLGWRIDIH